MRKAIILIMTLISFSYVATGQQTAIEMCKMRTSIADSVYCTDFGETCDNNDDGFLSGPFASPIACEADCKTKYPDSCIYLPFMPSATCQQACEKTRNSMESMCSVSSPPSASTQFPYDYISRSGISADIDIGVSATWQKIGGRGEYSCRQNEYCWCLETARKTRVAFAAVSEPDKVLGINNEDAMKKVVNELKRSGTMLEQLPRINGLPNNPVFVDKIEICDVKIESSGKIIAEKIGCAAPLTQIRPLFLAAGESVIFVSGTVNTYSEHCDGFSLTCMDIYDAGCNEDRSGFLWMKKGYGPKTCEPDDTTIAKKSDYKFNLGQLYGMYKVVKGATEVVVGAVTGNGVIIEKGVNDVTDGGAAIAGSNVCGGAKLRAVIGDDGVYAEIDAMVGDGTISVRDIFSKPESELTSEEKKFMDKAKEKLSEKTSDLLREYSIGCILESIGKKEFVCYNICAKTRTGVTAPDPSAPQCIPEKTSVATGYNDVIYDKSYGCTVSQPVAGNENPFNGVEGALKIDVKAPSGYEASIPLTITNGQISAEIDLRAVLGIDFEEGQYEILIGLDQE